MFLRRSLSGTVDSIGKSNICNIVKSSLTARFGVISTSKKLNENIHFPWALSFKNFIHSGNAKEFEAGGDSRNPGIGRLAVDRGMDNGGNPRNTNFGRSSLDANAGRGMSSGLNPRNANSGNGLSTVDPNFDRAPNFGNRSNAPEGYVFPRVNIEKEGDIVHIKMLQNNCFITVTDANGNKKFGSTTGIAEKGTGKIPRFSCEAVAELIGRQARERGIKSVVIKISGNVFFSKKKKAVLSFREGYSLSRLNKNPVVYVEDTTKRAHNGCRLPKRRRV